MQVNELRQTVEKMAAKGEFMQLQLINKEYNAFEKAVNDYEYLLQLSEDTVIDLYNNAVI